MDAFSESQRTMKTWSWAIQVEAGNTWDHISKESCDVDTKSWKHPWVCIEAALESGLYHSGTLIYQVQNNVLSCALSGPCHGSIWEVTTLQITTLITHSLIHLSFLYLSQSCVKPCAVVCFRYRNRCKIVSSLMSVQPRSEIMCQILQYREVIPIIKL